MQTNRTKIELSDAQREAIRRSDSGEHVVALLVFAAGRRGARYRNLYLAPQPSVTEAEIRAERAAVRYTVPVERIEFYAVNQRGLITRKVS